MSHARPHSYSWRHGRKWMSGGDSGREKYGSAIYSWKEGGKEYFSYTLRAKSDMNSKVWSPELWEGLGLLIPKGTKLAAKIHSHGAYDPERNGTAFGREVSQEKFSRQDLQSQSNDRIPYFLTTPGGRLRAQYPGEDDRSPTTICHCLPNDPKAPDKDKAASRAGSLLEMLMNIGANIQYAPSEDNNKTKQIPAPPPAPDPPQKKGF